MEILAYGLVGLPFVMALVLGLAIPMLILQLYRSVGFGIGMTAALFTFEALVPGFEGIQLGIRLYVPDLVTLLLGSTALLRFLSQRVARPRLLAWYVFVGAVFLSLGIGLSIFGTTAGVGARPYFYAVVITSYCLTFPGDLKMVRQLMTALAWVAVTLSALVVARWVITFVPITDLLPESGQFSSSEASLLRVISSQHAMILAQLFVVCLFYPLVAPVLRWLRPMLPLLLILVVSLQHRSVWLATMSAIGTRFALPEAGRKATGQLLMLAAVVLAVAVPVVFSGKLGGAAGDISQSASRAVALTDTADARLGSWDFMLRKWVAGGPRAVAIGLPMGTTAERKLLTDSGKYASLNFQAHNYFVQTVFNTGLLGVLSSVLVYLWIFLWLYRGVKDAEFGGASGVLLLLTTAQVVYYVFYGVDYFQALILGVAGALALTLRGRHQAASLTAKLPDTRGARPLPRPIVSSARRY